MKLKIALSQRVDQVAAYRETRDCLDQQWSRLLEHLDLLPFPVPNGLTDVQPWLGALKPDACLLTGGNDLAFLPGAKDGAEERDATEQGLLDYAHQTGIPVLGVCRGMQHLATYSGCCLQPVQQHVACRHALEQTAAATKIMLPVEVNSFHNWSVDPERLNPDWEILARAEDGMIEALRHRTLPWMGIMWHPERETPFSEADKHLITDFVKGLT